MSACVLTFGVAIVFCISAFSLVFQSSSLFANMIYFFPIRTHISRFLFFSFVSLIHSRCSLLHRAVVPSRTCSTVSLLPRLFVENVKDNAVFLRPAAWRGRAVRLFPLSVISNRSFLSIYGVGVEPTFTLVRRRLYPPKLQISPLSRPSAVFGREVKFPHALFFAEYGPKLRFSRSAAFRLPRLHRLASLRPWRLRPLVCGVVFPSVTLSSSLRDPRFLLSLFSPSTP